MPSQTINREDFLRALESVQAGLSPREIVEQSDCFVLRKGEVQTYNDEVACRCSIALGPEFKGSVKATPLLTILRKFPEDEITVEQTDTELIITGKRRQTGLRMEQQVSLKAIKKPTEWKPLPDDFAEAVNIVSQCAGKDESEWAMTCVHIHPKWIEATDRFQVCRWKMKTGISESTLVRQSSIKHIVSLGVIEYSESGSWLHFKNNHGLVLSCRRFLENYKDLTEYLKVDDGVPTTLPKGLADAADKAAVYSSENADKSSDHVMIELQPGKLKIEGRGITGWFTERKKIKYKGPAMNFLISPTLLMEFVKRHNDCEISPNRLKVTSGSYTYLACLSEPSSNGTAEEEETDNEGDEE